MKCKLFKFILAGCLMGTPLAASDNSDTIKGMIDNLFFEQNISRCTITVVEDGDKLSAIVKARTEGDKDGEIRRRQLEPFWAPTGWQMNDEDLFAQEKGTAKVLIGDNGLKVEKEYVKEYKHGYTFLKEAEEPLSEIIPNTSPAPVYKWALYERPDKTIYKKMGDLLYHMRIEELTTQEDSQNWCNGESQIIRWRGLNSQRVTNHNLTKFKWIKVTHKIFVTPPKTGADEELKETKAVQYEAQREHDWQTIHDGECHYKGTFPTHHNGLPVVKKF